jgi:hypothetical protein
MQKRVKATYKEAGRLKSDYRGADVSAMRKDGWILLNLVVQNGNIKVVKILFNSSVEILAITKNS